MTYILLALCLIIGRKFHSLLLLSLITKPNSDNILLQVEFFGDGGDFLRAWPKLSTVRFEVGKEQSTKEYRKHSTLYLGCTVKYASRLLFSGAAIEVLLRFFSLPLYPSASFFAFAAFSARSNQA